MIQAWQGKLPFMAAVKKFNPSNRHTGALELLETEHRANSQFHATVVLFYYVIPVFRRAKSYVIPVAVGGRQFSHGSV
jgi:hypothetical protein